MIRFLDSRMAVALAVALFGMIFLRMILDGPPGDFDRVDVILLLLLYIAIKD